MKNNVLITLAVTMLFVGNTAQAFRVIRQVKIDDKVYSQIAELDDFMAQTGEKLSERKVIALLRSADSGAELLLDRAPQKLLEPKSRVSKKAKKTKTRRTY